MNETQPARFRTLLPAGFVGTLTHDPEQYIRDTEDVIMQAVGNPDVSDHGVDMLCRAAVRTAAVVDWAKVQAAWARVGVKRGIWA
ncbi:hypothetical protein [Fimbriiglobus ruber]|uniref:Uncharacterized protein n=1 Tax=Fimbriiglobus ruber TaxID=1908690 RepID=A0A225D3Y3_9BACT|nr:hypothetical protein [Fimbriiglobus ruber]OWK34354.1 hypothetical protein FRUB_10325 [Fimbriiglobus ruber]